MPQCREAPVASARRDGKRALGRAPAGVADRTMWAEHLAPLVAAGGEAVAVAVDPPGFDDAVGEGEYAHGATCSRRRISCRSIGRRWSAARSAATSRCAWRWWRPSASRRSCSAPRADVFRARRDRLPRDLDGDERLVRDGDWQGERQRRQGEAGQPFRLFDSQGDLLIRDRGSLRFTIVVDTLGDDTPGGIVVEELEPRVRGPHPGFDDATLCPVLTPLLVGPDPA